MSKPSWRPCLTYEGMRVRYSCSPHQEATAHKNSDGKWYITWDNGTKSTCEGSGIRDTEIHECWMIISDTETQNTNVIDIKSANTRPEATNCIKCNGPLKDIGMGPSFKYCPACEP